MQHTIRIELGLQFQSKWHIGSGEGSLLTDRLIRRDARNWPYIPGSTLKGVIRESCEKLSRTLGFPDPGDPHNRELTHPDAFRPLKKIDSFVEAIFGNNYEGGKLFFRDARLETGPLYPSSTQSRTCLDRMLGTAKEKHLFTIEYALPANFKTTVCGNHQDLLYLTEEDPPFAYCLLIAGILKVDRLGGDKSTGKGRVKMSMSSILYNGREIPLETVFEYLDAEMARETREMYPSNPSLVISKECEGP